MNSNEEPCSAIYSEYGSDPSLDDLVQVFVDEIPDRVAVLEKALSSCDWELLCRTSHQLKGAAGSYGFHELSPLANIAEVAVRDGQQEEVIRRAIDDLIEGCGRLRAGEPK